MDCCYNALVIQSNYRLTGASLWDHVFTEGSTYFSSVSYWTSPFTWTSPLTRPVMDHLTPRPLMDHSISSSGNLMDPFLWKQSDHWRKNRYVISVESSTWCTHVSFFYESREMIESGSRTHLHNNEAEWVQYETSTSCSTSITCIIVSTRFFFLVGFEI